MTDEKPIIKVAVGLIRDEDRWIIARRDEKGRLPGQWEFPGGAVSNGNSLEEGLKEHLLKRFNIDVVVGDKLGTTAHEYDFGKVELNAFHVECISKKIKLASHLAYRKVKMNMFREFEMVASSAPVIELLKQHSD